MSGEPLDTENAQRLAGPPPYNPNRRSESMTRREVDDW